MGRPPACPLACSPCICAFFGTLELRHHLGIVLEYLDGGSLDRFLQIGESKRRHRPIGFGLRVRILREAASGISFLHERGYVHRDVKPANVLLTADHHAKVTHASLHLTSHLRSAPHFTAGHLTQLASHPSCTGDRLWHLQAQRPSYRPKV